MPITNDEQEFLRRFNLHTLTMDQIRKLLDHIREFPDSALGFTGNVATDKQLAESLGAGARSRTPPVERSEPFRPAIGTCRSTSTYVPSVVAPEPEPEKLGRLFSPSDVDTWADHANRVQRDLEDTRRLGPALREHRAKLLIDDFVGSVILNRRLPSERIRELRTRMEEIAASAKKN